MSNYKLGKIDIWYGDVPPQGSNGLWLKPDPSSSVPSLSKYDTKNNIWVPLVDTIDLSQFSSADLTYDPAVLTDWNGNVDPGTLATALDQLAARTKINDIKVTNANHTGDVTGSTSLSITNKAVTLAKMADIDTATFIGRKTVGSGAPESLTIEDAKSLLGIVPPPTSGVTITTEAALNICTTIDTYAVSLPPGGPIVTLLGAQVFSLEVLELQISLTPSPSNPLKVTQVAFVTTGAAKGTYSRIITYDGTSYTQTTFSLTSTDSSSFIHKTGNEIKYGVMSTYNYGWPITSQAQLDTILDNTGNMANIAISNLAVWSYSDISTSDLANIFGYDYSAETLQYTIKGTTIFTNQEFLKYGSEPSAYQRRVQRAFSYKYNSWVSRSRNGTASGTWNPWTIDENSYVLVADKFKLTSDRTGYFNTVSGVTNADFTTYDICKYRLTDTGGITANYVNTFSPGQDICKTIVIRNDYASTITITIPTTITGGSVTFTLVNMKATTTVDIPTGKQLEISYLFEYTGATAATVSISYFLQG